MDKFETIIGFCKKLGLPITFKALGIDQTVDERLMQEEYGFLLRLFLGLLR